MEIIFLIGCIFVVCFMGSVYLLRKKEAEITKKQVEITEWREKYHVVDKELSAETEKIKNFEDWKKQSKIEFTNIANEIMKEQGKNLSEVSEKSLKNLLNPLDKNLSEFKTQMISFSAINKRMTSETESLTNALSHNVKTQGDWGEFTLKSILEQSGLQEPYQYIIQGEGLELKSVEGKHQKPDVIINLPDKKHIIIDSKVTLKSYVDYNNTDNEEEKKQARKKFLHSINTHINRLSDKNYEGAKGLDSPDFVMMFMPIEAAYFFLIQENQDILIKAWEKGVIISCPSTLMANLRAVASLWRLQDQNENVEEIARLGGTIYDKVYGFLANMESVGKHLNTAQEKHDDAFKQLTTGRGSVLTQTEKLKELGAKTSKKIEIR